MNTLQKTMLVVAPLLAIGTALILPKTEVVASADIDTSVTSSLGTDTLLVRYTPMYYYYDVQNNDNNGLERYLVSVNVALEFNTTIKVQDYSNIVNLSTSNYKLYCDYVYTPIIGSNYKTRLDPNKYYYEYNSIELAGTTDFTLNNLNDFTTSDLPYITRLILFLKYALNNHQFSFGFTSCFFVQYGKNGINYNFTSDWVSPAGQVNGNVATILMPMPTFQLSNSANYDIATTTALTSYNGASFNRQNAPFSDSYDIDLTYNSNDLLKYFNNYKGDVYGEGYNKGYADATNDIAGSAPVSGVFGLLASAFNSVASIFNISVFENITIGTLLLIPLCVVIMCALIKLVGV